MMKATKTWVLIVLLLIPAINVHAWPIPDTGQTKCYNNTTEIPCPAPGEPFYGQDGNYTINPPSYTKVGRQWRRSVQFGNNVGDGEGQCDGTHLGEQDRRWRDS